MCSREGGKGTRKAPGWKRFVSGNAGHDLNTRALKDTFSLCRPLPPRTVLIEPVTSMPLARNQSQQVFMVTGTNGEAETRAKARERDRGLSQSSARQLWSRFL